MHDAGDSTQASPGDGAEEQYSTAWRETSGRKDCYRAAYDEGTKQGTKRNLSDRLIPD